MTKKEKREKAEMQQYIMHLCKDANVYYDPENDTHLEDPAFNELLARDVQSKLDYLTAEGFCDKVGDKYVYADPAL